MTSSPRTIWRRRRISHENQKSKGADLVLEERFDKRIVLGKVEIESRDELRVTKRDDPGKNIRGLDERDRIATDSVAGGLADLHHIGEYGAVYYKVNLVYK